MNNLFVHNWRPNVYVNDLLAPFYMGVKNTADLIFSIGQKNIRWSPSFLKT